MATIKHSPHSHDQSQLIITELIPITVGKVTYAEKIKNKIQTANTKISGHRITNCAPRKRTAKQQDAYNREKIKKMLIYYQYRLTYPANIGKSVLTNEQPFVSQQNKNTEEAMEKIDFSIPDSLGNSMQYSEFDENLHGELIIH